MCAAEGTSSRSSGSPEKKKIGSLEAPGGRGKKRQKRRWTMTIQEENTFGQGGKKKGAPKSLRGGKRSTPFNRSKLYYRRDRGGGRLVKRDSLYVYNFREKKKREYWRDPEGLKNPAKPPNNVMKREGRQDIEKEAAVKGEELSDYPHENNAYSFGGEKKDARGKEKKKAPFPNIKAPIPQKKGRTKKREKECH